MSVTEVEHLRAEVARLQAQLAEATAPRTPPAAPGDLVTRAVDRLERSIEILTAAVDGPFPTAAHRLAAIGLDGNNPVEVGMAAMAFLAAPLLDAQAQHAADHGVVCPQMVPVEMVRSYARATASTRAQLGAPKAGG